MIPAETIKRKRNGQEHTSEEIRSFVNSYVSGKISDYQMAAWLMAVYFKGLSKKELWALTDSMLHSGKVLDLSQIPGLKVDKHSTGGVGDKTSLIVGPIAAAAGVKIPMISGRGLGHTGGTLDKLESMPDFRTQISLEAFENQVRSIGIAFGAQTAEICPADKKMYALRDVTGTVESLHLISASIMCKKLAEGIDGLVLDVKFGSGAFMKTLKDAKKLARTLIEIGKSSGKKVHALLTDMNQVLGYAVGNALEVQECIEVLEGKGPQDLRELSLELAAHMIWIGKRAKNLKAAQKLAAEILDSGQAFKLFKEIVRLQGGSLDLPKAENRHEVRALRKGSLTQINVEEIGLASLLLGAGRLKTQDSVDPSAGLLFYKKIGDQINKGDLLATLFYNGSKDVDLVHKKIEQACEIRLQKGRSLRLIKEVITT